MIRYIAADRIEMAHPYIKGTGNKSNPLAIQVYLLQKESIVGREVNRIRCFLIMSVL